MRLAVRDQVVFVAVTEDRRLTGELEIERASFGEGDAGMSLDGGRPGELIGERFGLLEERRFGVAIEAGIRRQAAMRPREFNDECSFHV